MLGTSNEPRDTPTGLSSGDSSPAKVDNKVDPPDARPGQRASLLGSNSFAAMQAKSLALKEGMSTYAGSMSDTMNKQRSSIFRSARASTIAGTTQFGLANRTFEDFELRWGAGLAGDEDKMIEIEGEMPAGMIIECESRVDGFLCHILWFTAIYDLGFVPFFLSFLDFHNLEDNQDMRYVDMVVNLLCARALASRFWTSQIDLRLGKEVVDIKRIRKRVIKSQWFWVDLTGLLASCVFWMVPLWNSELVWPFALRLLRCWRILHTQTETTSTAQTELSASVYLVELGRLVASVFAVSHLFGCLWFCIGGLDPVNANPDKYVGSYLSAVFEATMMILGTTLPPNWTSAESTIAQIVTATVISIFGALHMSFVFAQLILIVQRMTILNLRQSENMALIQAAMRSLDVPQSLQVRVLSYHRFVAIFHHQEAYSALMSGLSKNLLIELKIFLFRGLIQRASFFSQLEPQLINRIVMAFEEVVFSPGDVIIRKGELADEMYFLIKGTCEVHLQNFGDIVATKQSGDFFGEVALLTNQPRTAWILAKSYCVCARLTKGKFDHVISNHAGPKEQILQTIRNGFETGMRGSVTGMPGAASYLQPIADGSWALSSLTASIRVHEDGAVEEIRGPVQARDEFSDDASEVWGAGSHADSEVCAENLPEKSPDDEVSVVISNPAENSVSGNADSVMVSLPGSVLGTSCKDIGKESAPLLRVADCTAVETVEGVNVDSYEGKKDSTSVAEDEPPGVSSLSASGSPDKSLKVLVPDMTTHPSSSSMTTHHDGLGASLMTTHHDGLGSTVPADDVFSTTTDKSGSEPESEARSGSGRGKKHSVQWKPQLIPSKFKGAVRTSLKTPPGSNGGSPTNSSRENMVKLRESGDEQTMMTSGQSTSSNAGPAVPMLRKASETMKQISGTVYSYAFQRRTSRPSIHVPVNEASRNWHESRHEEDFKIDSPLSSARDENHSRSPKTPSSKRSSKRWSATSVASHSTDHHQVYMDPAGNFTSVGNGIPYAAGGYPISNAPSVSGQSRAETVRSMEERRRISTQSVSFSRGSLLAQSYASGGSNMADKKLDALQESLGDIKGLLQELLNRVPSLPSPPPHPDVVPLPLSPPQPKAAANPPPDKSSCKSATLLPSSHGLDKPNLDSTQQLPIIDSTQQSTIIE